MHRDDTFTTADPPRPRPHGGRRAGAGRPPAYTEPLLRTTVRLPRSYVAQLRAFGMGNLSEGIRYLVEFAYDRDGRPWFAPESPTPKAPSTPTKGAPLPR